MLFKAKKCKAILLCVNDISFQWRGHGTTEDFKEYADTLWTLPLVKQRYQVHAKRLKEDLRRGEFIPEGPPRLLAPWDIVMGNHIFGKNKVAQKIGRAHV